MRDLLLTLGHNASAVLVEDGHVLNAYEAERLTGVKSDSRFPVEAIQAIASKSRGEFDRLYVTHWAPGGNVDHMKSKYWDRSAFRKEMPVYSQETMGLTHHDAHAYAAVAFAGRDFPSHDTGILVIDGFGTMSEHISYYRLARGIESDYCDLQVRVFGYGSSLGLMYQYVTAALGLKMHEDEYKLLGYGARIDPKLIEEANEIAFALSKQMLQKIRNRPDPDISIELEGLPKVQAYWANRVKWILDEIGAVGQDPASESSRMIVGYVVQRTLETVVLNFVNEIGWPANLICSGGVFYNVGLNRILLNQITGKLCINPLAGDQGNSLGLWAAHNRSQTLEFGDLCWGIRGNSSTSKAPEGFFVFDEDDADLEKLIRENLMSNGFINIVRGRMEFGPRALCNTTTLAVASDMKVVDEINRINGRNTVMPFAPVVWHEHVAKAFPTATKLHKSERFMICAADYRRDIGEAFPGAALKTAYGKLTGRPQSYAPKYEKDSVAAVLKDYGVLINTSFNVHGVPIVCNIEQAIHCHEYQRQHNPRVVTAFVKEKLT